MSFQDNIRRFLNSRFGSSVLSEDLFRDELSFYIRPDALVSICQAFLDDDSLDIRFLKDITSVDWFGNQPEEAKGRFEVVYNFYSLKHKARFFLKVRLPVSNPEVSSLTALFQAADWLEREVWDMMGIVFTGHPDLTKILTADELEGHPLRRDFPLTYEQPRFSWNKDNPPEVIK
ncbi:MAG: NADH-quinone oxidoreductase subunit C [candidate division Zixibacteria bacterium]